MQCRYSLPRTMMPSRYGINLIILNSLIVFLLLVTGPVQALTEANKTLIIGSEQDYPPFAIGATDQTASGFTVDLWKAVAAESGLNYTIRVRPFHQLLEEFKDGKFDVLINLAQSEEPRRFADFTVPTVIVHGAVFVRKGDSAIRSEADLKGKAIIVLNADKAHDYALSKGWQQLVTVNTAEEGFKLLSAGRHDAMVISKLVGLQTLNKLKIANIEAVKTTTGFAQKFSFAVKKDNSELLAKINEGLALTKSSGVYDSLYEKWFGLYQEQEDLSPSIIKITALLLVIFIATMSVSLIRRAKEQKEAARKLQASHNLLKTIIDTAPARIFWKDRDSLFLGSNMSFAQDAGLTHPDELLGKDDYQMPWRDQAEFYRADDRKVMNSGIPKLAYDEPQTTPEGKKIWLRTSKVPLRNADNETIGLLGIYQDITEKKLAENELRKLSLAVEQSPNMIVITDLNATIEFVNEAFVRATGYSRSEAIGQNARLLQSSKTPKESYTDMWTKLTAGKVWKGEFINKRKDGSEYIESAMISPVHQPDSSITHYLAIKEDITERKRIEQQLRIAATAFESGEGMVIIDVDHIILRVNKAFTNITGYTAEDVVGKNACILQSSLQNNDFYKTMWEHINNTGSWEGEIISQRKNGDIYPEYLTITAVKDQSDMITHYVKTLTDITQRKSAAEEIERLAFYDPLTNLPNRRLLLDRLNLALASSHTNNRKGALLFIDLDNFKTLNDTLGHDRGDLLLQQVAARLSACIRESDTVARLGGDEFVIMLEDLSAQTVEAVNQAEAVGNKIIANINAPFLLAQLDYLCTSSIGATLFNGHEQTVDELLKQADIAMYQAKISGRNALRFFDQQMQDIITARVSLENELRKALGRQQFQLYYQIQVDDSHQPLGAEALLRWSHPDRGMVSLPDFIPLAEETSLIQPIGQWVLETACAQLKKWQQMPFTSGLILSVNVSARQFFQTDFVALVLAAIKRHDINPMLLKLELTESTLLDHIEDTIHIMNILRKTGIRFSLDDFGTGYSSLQYLKVLPLDQLKIDQSFVRDIVVDNGDQAIVRTIIAMAASLNLHVIAEGVETKEQRQLLLNNGCTNIQGYLFSEPLPIAEFEALLKQGIKPRGMDKEEHP